MKEKKIKPELYFSCNSVNWKTSKMRDISSINQGLQISISNRYTSKVPNSYFYITNEFLKEGSKSEYYIFNPPNSVLCNESDILMTRTGNTGEVVTNVKGAFHNNFFKIKYDSNIDKKFLVSFLRSEKTQKLIRELAGVSTIPDLNHNDFYNIVIHYPHKSEQQQIGILFKNIDDLIYNYKKKQERLETLKKSMLEKMFPKEGQSVPEIRFKGFYEDWKSDKLNNFGNTYTGLSGKTKKDFGHGDAKYITYMNVFANPIASPFLTDSVEIDGTQNCVEYGDVLFTVSSETPEEVGLTSVWTQNKENIYLNSFCFGYRPSLKFDVTFLANAFRSSAFREKITLLAQGISRFNISKTKVMDLELSFPDYEEQVKIGLYFKNLEDLISNHKKQLQNLNNLKQSFSEKMFV